jgi:Na+-driven multidrug efflux pump
LNLKRLKIISKICAFGASSFITQAAICVVLTFVNNTITFYGAQSVYGADIPLASFGIALKVNQIMLGVCVGITVGSAPILSFNYGARQMKRGRETMTRCIAVSVLIMVFATICYEFFPKYIVMLFGSGSELYEQFLMKTFRIYLCFSILSGFQTTAGIFFQAIGKPFKSIVISLSRQFFFFIPLAWLMSRFMGVEGVLWAGPAGDILAFLLVLPLVIVQFSEFKKIEN